MSEVTIKLDKSQVPVLLGALKLGLWLQNWCEGMAITILGSNDSYFINWSPTLEKIVGTIRTQTKVKKENLGYAGCKTVIDEIIDWVYGQFELKGKDYEVYKRVYEKSKSIRQSLPSNL